MQTPEEKRKEKEAAAAALKERAEHFKACVDKVLSSEPGREVFRYLFEICGYAKSSRSTTSTGAIDPIGTTINDARREIYLQLRAHAEPGLLAEVEYPRKNVTVKEENK